MTVELIVAGASLGGFEALATLLSALPEDYPLPLAIVQHRSAESDDLLSVLLQRTSRLPLTEVEDKQTILPGRVYIAPANYHLLVERKHFALSVDDRVRFAQPTKKKQNKTTANTY